MSSDYTRVYTYGGVKAHLLSPLLSPNSPNSALCGRSPGLELWHGTGAQEEYERAADLELCSLCEIILKERRDGVEIR